MTCLSEGKKESKRCWLQKAFYENCSPHCLLIDIDCFVTNVKQQTLYFTYCSLLYCVRFCDVHMKVLLMKTSVLQGKDGKILAFRTSPRIHMEHGNKGNPQKI